MPSTPDPLEADRDREEAEFVAALGARGAERVRAERTAALATGLIDRDGDVHDRRHDLANLSPVLNVEQ